MIFESIAHNRRRIVKKKSESQSVIIKRNLYIIKPERDEFCYEIHQTKKVQPMLYLPLNCAQMQKKRNQLPSAHIVRANKGKIIAMYKYLQIVMNYAHIV